MLTAVLVGYVQRLARHDQGVHRKFGLEQKENRGRRLETAEMTLYYSVTTSN